LLIDRPGTGQKVERVWDTIGMRGTCSHNITFDSHLMTDSAPVYVLSNIGKPFARHSITDHSKGEYARPGSIHSNTVESAFSLLKRGIYGTFHNVSRKDLHRYVAEIRFSLECAQSR
jgi:transposase